ncbi:MAG: efflux RND transporter periplasmic adaptor subunit [Marivirga sp.]|nr:efflux RND transporter periplasmic adaptor subunit [Marivirga sp.]
MKKNILIVLSVVIFTAVTVTIYFTFFRNNTVDMTVETTMVKTGSISKLITATGTVEPLTKVEVGTQVSGVIEKILVDFNSKVKANQLIAELDKTNLKAALSETTAILNTALNEQDYQQKNFERINKLFNSKVVSQTDYEEALYKLNNAKSIVEQRRSDLSKARTNLSYANIYSPIDGVVISRAVDVGQTVAASFSTPTLFTIAQDLKQMQVEADVDEADIGQVKVGQRVSFTVDAYPDDSFSGTVTQVRLEPVEESNVITYTVIIKADNPEKKLMPGLTASISIYTQEINNVLVVEVKALNFRPDEKLIAAYNQMEQLKDDEKHISLKKVPPSFSRSTNNKSTPSDITEEDKLTVWIKEGGQIRAQVVKTGASDGISTQITEGLKEGDLVVYAMTTKSSDESGSSENTSPFMPKPPGQKKK